MRALSEPSNITNKCDSLMLECDSGGPSTVSCIPLEVETCATERKEKEKRKRDFCFVLVGGGGSRQLNLNSK